LALPWSLPAANGLAAAPVLFLAGAGHAAAFAPLAVAVTARARPDQASSLSGMLSTGATLDAPLPPPGGRAGRGGAGGRRGGRGGLRGQDGDRPYGDGAETTKIGSVLSGPVAQPGQSGRLIIGWSWVRSPAGPPPAFFDLIRVELERFRYLRSWVIGVCAGIY